MLIYKMLLILLIIFGVCIFYDTYLKSYFLINATLNNYLYTISVESQQSYFRLQRMTTGKELYDALFYNNRNNPSIK